MSLIHHNLQHFNDLKDLLEKITEWNAWKVTWLCSFSTIYQLKKLIAETQLFLKDVSVSIFYLRGNIKRLN